MSCPPAYRFSINTTDVSCPFGRIYYTIPPHFYCYTKNLKGFVKLRAYVALNVVLNTKAALQPLGTAWAASEG